MEGLVTILVWLGVALFFTALGFLFYVFLREKRRGVVRSSLGMDLFLVRLPKYEEGGQNENLQQIVGKAEQLYAAFSQLGREGFWKRIFNGTPRVAFEIASESRSEEVGFYIAVSTKKRGQLEKALHGVYPEAFMERIEEDYNIFTPGGASAAGVLFLEESSFLPLNTYQHMSSDPLNTIATTLSKLPESQGGAIQLVLTPVDKKWKKAGKQVLQSLREGKSLSGALHEVYGLKLPLFSSSSQEKEEASPSSADEDMVKKVQSKTGKVNFRANVRLVASAKDKEAAESILGQIQGAFGQFSAADSNAFKPVELRGKKLKREIFDFSFRSFTLKRSIVLNTEELAGLFHLSLSNLEVPKLKALRSRESSLPKELPENGVITIGKASYRGQEQTVSFSNREDRRRHLYSIGQTGTGKTSLFREMIRQDMEAGEGVGVIDPHGDLVEDTLANVPKERVEDVVLFEPFDTERPAGLNMLEWQTPQQKDFAVQEMITIFQKLFPPEVIGPMFEHYMRNAMLALMADQENPGTLVEIPRIFTDEEFMEKKIQAVEDPVVKQFWEKEWKETTGQTKSDMLGYVVSKIGRFVENETLRNIIGQRQSSFDLSSIMNEGKIFLANLSKGQTGEVNASLLGLVLVSKLQMAAMRRAESKSEEERKDFYLYMDEFQNFTTDSIATILSEARKYRLNLNIAHQFTAQLDEKIRDAVFGNVGTMVSFRVSSEDGEVMEKQFEPEFGRRDLVNLDNFHAVAKLMVNGQTTTPFRMRSVKPREGNRDQIDAIKKMSKMKYGRPKEEVDQEIRERANL